MMVTPLYAAVLALIFLVLSVRTLLLRRRYQVAVGHGGEAALERAGRAHGNFAEYVPFALILIYFLERASGAAWTAHLLGSALLLGRLIHCVGISRVKEDYRLRVAGMTLTFSVLAGAAMGVLLARWLWP